MNNKHAEVLSYEEDAECDMCDSKKYETAIISCLGDDCIVICKKCLENILSKME
jgi:hypothetical protein